MAASMWPNQEETVELLNGAKHGDKEAVNRLLQRHCDSLHRMVRCRLNPGVAGRVAASDIVQEALLVASRRLAEYLQKPGAPFHAWLRQLARDRLADAYRRELADKRDVSREQKVGVSERSSLNPLAQIRDDELTPAAMLLRKEFAQRFHQAVDCLDEDAKEIILMRHAERLTNSQVAELLGLSEPAAGMRYLRALRQLKSRLGETPSMF
jgi:RNA polymerase sigma-70 factor, ECF subfamily